MKRLCFFLAFLPFVVFGTGFDVETIVPLDWDFAVDGSVTSASWVEVMRGASTAARVTEIEIQNESGVSLQLGISPSASDPTSTALTVFKGGIVRQAFFIPVNSFVFLKGYSSDATSGEFYINFFKPGVVRGH